MTPRRLDSQQSVDMANIANTTRNDYDRQESLLRGEESPQTKLWKAYFQIIGMIGIGLGLAAARYGLVDAKSLPSHDPLAGGTGPRHSEISEGESSSSNGVFAEGLGVDRVQDSGVITLAENPNDKAIAWVLSGGKQGAIDANVVWLKAHSRGGDDHEERTNLSTHVLGIKQFADGTMWVVASKMPNTGNLTVYAPVPTKVESEVVELPLITDGTNWGIQRPDGSFQPLFVGQFDKTFKLPINEDDNKISEAAMSIFDSAISNPATDVVLRNDPLPTPDVKIVSNYNLIDYGIDAKYETQLVELKVTSEAIISYNVITDDTLVSFSGLNLNPEWRNAQGQSSDRSVAEFTSRSIYEASVANNGYVGTYEQYMTDLAKAQNGGNMEDWMKVAVTFKVSELGDKYNPVSMTMLPFYVDAGLVLPSDIRVFTEVDFVLAKVNDIKNKDKILQESDYALTAGRYGFGTNISPDGKLYAVIGVPTDMLDRATPGSLAGAYMSLWTDTLKKGTANVIHGGYYHNPSMIEYLLSNVKRLKTTGSALK